MKITAKLFESTLQGVLATGSITLDGCFVVTGIKLREGKNGLWVAMPSQKVKEEYKDVCFALNKEFRQQINDAVIAEWNNRAGEAYEPEMIPQIKRSAPIDEEPLPF